MLKYGKGIKQARVTPVTKAIQCCIGGPANREGKANAIRLGMR